MRMCKRGGRSGPRGLLLAASLLLAVPARAQIAGGEITGVIRDGAGAAVPGATITVTETGRNRPRVTVSSGQGVYTTAALLPGEYRVDVQLAGVKRVRRDGIRLETGETVRLDFTLTVG